MTVRFALVGRDDLCLSLKRGLTSWGGFSCVGHYRSAADAMTRLPTARSDLAIMELDRPELGGVEVVQQFKALLPEVRLIVITPPDNWQMLFESLMAGAAGVLV